MPIIFTLVATDDAEFITPFIPGRAPLPIDSTHPNFNVIKAACLASLTEDVDAERVADLLDVAATVERGFARLSERVTADAHGVYFDGDRIESSLEDQILGFLDAGEDFAPLVNFYEKLADNPIGDVRAGLYAWIKGQTSDGSKVTITEDGDLVGYKGVWGNDEGQYRPSRFNTVPMLINDVPSPKGDYAWQGEGDRVEMPRANVSAPSYECGVGLHVGTWSYAKSFGPTCLKVRFNPRDVVSAPDANSGWKLRVIRYTVLEVIEDGGCAHETAVYRDPQPEVKVDVTFDADAAIRVGDTVTHAHRTDEGVVEAILGGDFTNQQVKVAWADTSQQQALWQAQMRNLTKVHGKGGGTSQAAKGRGRNPAQDSAGRFSGGRPGSARNGSTGRFA